MSGSSYGDSERKEGIYEEKVQNQKRGLEDTWARSMMSGMQSGDERNDSDEPHGGGVQKKSRGGFGERR